MSTRQRSLREARHVDKSGYLGSDERFYEQSYDAYVPSDELADIVRDALQVAASAWQIKRVGVWSHVVAGADPDGPQLPVQGWKIHLSATESNCRKILGVVAGLALEHRLLFKFANDINTMRLMTSKRWPRGGSGKFITVYPVDTVQFRQFIDVLHDALEHEIGSYILSDRRYKACRCLYYRYGGIRQIKRLDYMGQQVPMLVSPSGEHVPDLRRPYFDVPSWEQDPFPADDDDGSMTLACGRYSIQSALGFSNTGGVYHAVDSHSGRDVVIKEARPHVELHGQGADATDRLKREQRNLELLSAVGVSPAVLDTFWDWENFYLVEEKLDAYDLREVMLKHSPLLKARPALEDSEAFYASYVAIFTALLAAVQRAHEAGIVIGDISPPNILVSRTDMSVRIIDLEAAFLADSDESDDIHTPGFRRIMKGRRKASTFEDDAYAAAAVMLYSMFPIVAMAYIRDDLMETVLPTVLADIGWQSTPVGTVIQGLASGSLSLAQAQECLRQPASISAPYPASTRPYPQAGEVVRRLAAYIKRHARMQADRTLFPVDPFSAHTNTASLGFGAAGVVHALAFTGHALGEEAAGRYRRESKALDRNAMPPGFLTGLAGLAWVALEAGDIELAAAHLDAANRAPLASAHHSLYYGIAGIGLANLAMYLAIPQAGYLEQALAHAATLRASAIHTERGVHWQDQGGTRIGLGYGQAGVALFLLRLSQVTSDTAWHELGRQALQHDLSYGFELEPGVTTFPCAPEEVNTYEPYIEQGTAGIAKVAIRYGLWDDVDRLLLDVHRKYSGFCGLIYGLAGMLDVFVDAFHYSGDVRYRELAARPYQGICDLYLMHEDEASAVPGENLFRVSFDHATGMAGVMQVLHRYERNLPDTFFLDVLDAPRRAEAEALTAAAEPTVA